MACPPTYPHISREIEMLFFCFQPFHPFQADFIEFLERRTYSLNIEYMKIMKEEPPGFDGKIRESGSLWAI